MKFYKKILFKILLEIELWSCITLDFKDDNYCLLLDENTCYKKCLSRSLFLVLTYLCWNKADDLLDKGPDEAK